MILSDRTMKLLMELDAPVDQKVALLNSMRTDEAAALPSRSKGAERQARYEARRRQKSSESVSDDAERQIYADALSPSLSPQTPQTHPHTRECITTPPRKADDFERFWAVYPKRVAKDAARKAFDRAIKRASLAEIVEAVERQRDWEQWQRGFIPNAATWLNAGQWADEEPPGTQPNTATRKAHDQPYRQTPDRNDKLRAMLAGAMEAVDDAKHGL